MNFTAANYEFFLTTGPKCVVREFLGDDYATISKKRKGESFADNQNRLLADILVSVGSLQMDSFTKNKDRESWVKRLHTSDRTQILAVARQFSFDFPNEFPFSWKGEDSTGKAIQKDLVFTFDKPEGVNDKDFIPLFPTKNAAYQATEYTNLPDMIDTTLPKSGLQVRMEISTGEVEERMTSKEEPSLIDMISCRNPTYKEGEVWLPLKLGKLPARDITHLFNKIKDTEGKVDSELRFDHPDAENMPETKKKVVVNLLGVADFFLPSEGKV